MCFGLSSFRKERLAKERSKKIDMELKQDGLEYAKIVKVLLLGSRASGKCTVMKQLITQLGNSNLDGFVSEDLTQYCQSSPGNSSLVNYSVVNQLVAILRAMPAKRISFQDEKRELDSKMVLDAADRLDGELRISEELLHAMKRLWVDYGVQKCFRELNPFGENYSAKHFLDNLDRIGGEDYQPTAEDILLTKMHRNAVLEFNCSYRNLIFKFVEIVGQRSEHKWTHQFEQFPAIIFCVALSDYDKVEPDQNGSLTNLLQESLKRFDLICNSDWFRDASFIVLLNKKDIFEKKLKSIPLSVCFPEYRGSHSYDEATAYIQAQFEAKNLSNDREVYTYVT